MISGRESKSKTRKHIVVTEQNPLTHYNTFLTQSAPSYENDREGAYHGTGYSVKFSTKIDGSPTRNRLRFDDQQIEHEGNQYATRKIIRSQQHFNLPLTN